MQEEIEFNIFKAQILEDIKAGKPLFGKDGALAPMIENIVNAALEGEMDAHLTQESRVSGNRRNGQMQKQVLTRVRHIQSRHICLAACFGRLSGHLFN